MELGEYSDVDQFLTQSLILNYHTEEAEGIAQARYLLVRITINQGRYKEAEQALAECEMIYRELNDARWLALVAY